MLELMIIIIEDFMKNKTKDNNENLLDKKNLQYLRESILLEVEDEINPEENESEDDLEN